MARRGGKGADNDVAIANSFSAIPFIMNTGGSISIPHLINGKR